MVVTCQASERGIQEGHKGHRPDDPQLIGSRSGASCYVGHQPSEEGIQALGSLCDAFAHWGVERTAIPLSWVRKLRPTDAKTHRGPWVRLEHWQLDLDLCLLAWGLAKNAQ